MKTSSYIFLLAVAVTLCSAVSAQEKSYKEGSVWQVGFIKVGANMSVDYLNSLKSNWKATQDEAVKEGLILSYKILEGTASNPDDWDIMLMTEFRNLSAMEGSDDKWDAISKKVIGGQDAMKKLNESRVNVRTIYGGKLLREINYN